ncbi:HAD family hydrolase [Amycolatopsis pigmentata]|uniref:HAD family hydrolase n=1 Tax=Amycolatopsis pigmentata TaxID=450801 RepID=A0ABW5FWT6_9PSEU
MSTSAASPRTLVLWDIDHTLIETRGAGRAIYERAFLATTGAPLTELAPVSGRTELDIMHDSLRLNGLHPTGQAIADLATALARGYEDAREELATTGRALPGAKEALETLARDPTIHQAVLTGNLREVARVKLEVFGLDQYLDLDSSAYGDDAADRAVLVRVAHGGRRTAQAADSTVRTPFWSAIRRTTYGQALWPEPG